MNYTPTEWQSGDIVSAEKLNKIENELKTLSQNIGCEVAFVTGDITLNSEQSTEDIECYNITNLSHTFIEIGGLINNGKMVFFRTLMPPYYSGAEQDIVTVPLIFYSTVSGIIIGSGIKNVAVNNSGVVLDTFSVSISDNEQYSKFFMNTGSFS